MHKKLLGTYLLIIFVTIVFTVTFSWNKVNNYFYERVELESDSQIKLLRDILIDREINTEDDFQQFAIEYSEKINSRITIVDLEGNVIAESHSDTSSMDNHLYREEISKVIKYNDIYSSFRYSNTLKAYYLYVAMPLELEGFSGVLRTATAVAEIESIIYDMLKIIAFGMIFGVIIAMVIAYIFSEKMMNPIKELTNAVINISDGNYDEKIYIRQQDEVGQLAEAFNKMSFKLKINMWKLEHKNAELESILASMSNGIIAIDNDYKIALYNEKFLELFKITQKDIKDKLFYEVTRNLVVFEVVEKSLEQREYVVKETKFFDENEEKILLIYANPIKAKNQPNINLGVLLVVQDVTQIRKLETMRSDFVSNVTHELKTPLTSIRGFVDTLKNGAINDEKVATKFLDIIDIEAERLEGLIQDILILSEIEAMAGDKNISEYNIKEIIEEVLEILSPKYMKKNLEMIINIEDGITPFKCNKNRIKQLLINVVENAIKYTEKGYVKINCREDFKYLSIEVEDTGIGVDKKHIPRLFERFYRVDKGRSRKMGGTGLGLSIVKHIVELYNGKIKVESKLGEGTKMIIRLPY